MSLAAAVNDQDASARARYDKLEDRVLARDQVGASESYYDLVRDGRPLPEMLREAVRIHGPYTHVPYHERIDNGFVNFVNNDHCLLCARATLNLAKCCRPSWPDCRWRRPSGTSRPVSTSGTRRSTRRRVTTRVAWRPQKQRAAEARRVLAGPGAGASRRAVARPARPMADAGASRPRDRSLSRLSRTDAEQARAQGGAGRAGVRRPDRFAGPCLPQPLLYHRPQVLSGARDGRDRQRPSAGTTRMPCSMPARWISPSVRAGIRPTRWRATA